MESRQHMADPIAIVLVVDRLAGQRAVIDDEIDRLRLAAVDAHDRPGAHPIAPRQQSPDRGGQRIAMLRRQFRAAVRQRLEARAERLDDRRYVPLDISHASFIPLGYPRDGDARESNPWTSSFG